MTINEAARKAIAENPNANRWELQTAALQILQTPDEKGVTHGAEASDVMNELRALHTPEEWERKKTPVGTFIPTAGDAAIILPANEPAAAAPAPKATAKKAAEKPAAPKVAKTTAKKATTKKGIKPAAKKSSK